MLLGLGMLWTMIVLVILGTVLGMTGDLSMTHFEVAVFKSRNFLTSLGAGSHSEIGGKLILRGF